ncbi:sensor histidine kinase [Pararhodonellum marinum]|uniref:sensor histidine kinase n=1 Tax=Pararhodonellum marinum TaxID=2755358 RepID=UPI00188DDFDB|nr:histidine kinase [Pararhodonellum marinum]
MKEKRTHIIFSVLIFLLVLGYWLFRFQEIVTFEILETEENYLGSIAVYLLSWSFVFLLINLVAWLNFRYVFLKWKESFFSSISFIAIELILLALVFELLQWTTQGEEELMKDNLTVTLIIALYFLAFTWVSDLIHVKRKQAKLLQQKERAELMLLQSQLNPHFLFNALNTTYSTAMSEGSEQTASQILQLSGLMRFALEKSKLDMISIEDELGFLEKYIQVHKDRYRKKGKDVLNVQVVWDGIEVQISPMMVQPLIENTFKFADFGSESGKVKLEIDLKVEDGELTLVTQNYFSIKHVNENKGTGQGIQLVKQRLKSIYPNRHALKIEDDGAAFKVFLKINLKE